MKSPASLHALTENLIDYAGLFPPAALSMNEAVRNYAAYAKSNHAWMLARFITPVARLDEFQHEYDQLAVSEKPWRISALSSPDAFEKDLARVLEFNRHHASRIVIDAFEIKVESRDEINRVARLIKPTAHDFDIFFELALDARLPEMMQVANRAHAKIRTGGVTSAQIPSSAEVLNFIRLCQHHKTSFKATAGLHHPVRGDQALTYETEAPRATMHGFINVFLASAFVFNGMNDTDARGLLEETNQRAFGFTDYAATWRDRQISTAQITDARRRFALSFGSCSFIEPVEDLQNLKLIT